MNGLLFDLGGTFLRAGIAGSDGSVTHCRKTRICSVAHRLPPDEIWRRILDSVLDYEAEHAWLLPEDAPVVVSFPGPISKDRAILQAPTVAGSCTAGLDLPDAVRAATGRQVAVLNDVSSAAWKIAESSPVHRFGVVTVSSGIGSKLFDRCHASGVIDQPPYAGEIGHVVVDDRPDAPVCDCGARGHLGAVASGRAIERIVRDRASADHEAFAGSMLTQSFGATVGDLTNERHIVPAVLAGDRWTEAIVRECTRPLVRSLLTVTMAAGLERIYFIGGFANALGEKYLGIVRALARELSKYEVAQQALESLFDSGPAGQETCLEGCAAYLKARVVFHDRHYSRR